MLTIRNNEIYVYGICMACSILFFLIIPDSYKWTYLFYSMIVCSSCLLVMGSDSGCGRKYEKILFWVGIFIIGFVFSFRNQIGSDDYTYEIIYYACGEDFSHMAFENEQEIGYTVLCWIVYRFIGRNYLIAQCIISYFAFYWWGKAIKVFQGFGKFSVFPLLIWIYYYPQVMGNGLVRIFIALPICLFALQYLWKEQWIKFILFILLASSFHYSSLVMLFLIAFMFGRRLIYRYWVIFLGACFVLIPLFMNLAVEYIVPNMGAKYIGYLSTGMLSVSISDFDTLPIFLAGLYFLKYMKDEKRKVYIIGLVLLGTSCIFSIYSSYHGFIRLIFYANLGILIIVPLICNTKIRKKSDFIVLGLLIAYNMAYLLHAELLNDTINYKMYPYESFLGGK